VETENILIYSIEYIRMLFLPFTLMGMSHELTPLPFEISTLYLPVSSLSASEKPVQ